MRHTIQAPTTRGMTRLDRKTYTPKTRHKTIKTDSEERLPEKNLCASLVYHGNLNIKFMQIKLNENDRKVVTHKAELGAELFFPVLGRSERKRKKFSTR
jgi:hypothetical protein